MYTGDICYLQPTPLSFKGVSQWPKLEGRFPQVGGIQFAFDPSKPAGQRIDPQFIRVGDEYLDLKQKYRLVTKGYLHLGRDGYDVLKDCLVLVSEEDCPEIITSIQNHFESIKILTGNKQSHTHHRQSLICLSRRASVVKMHEITTTHNDINASYVSGENVHRPLLKKGVSLDATARRNVLKRGSSLDSIEYEQCRLEPKVEGRITVMTEEVKKNMSKSCDI